MGDVIRLHGYRRDTPALVPERRRSTLEASHEDAAESQSAPVSLPFDETRSNGLLFVPESTISTTLLFCGTLLIRNRLRIDIHCGLDVGLSQQFLLHDDLG
jgi:hypothetical protein